MMDEMTLVLADEADTGALGAALGDALKVGDVISLSGPLGAGKTTLSRAIIAQRCGVADAPSPTFTLVESYPGDGLTIWHFDFYRLKSEDEVWELGVEEAFSEGASLIEWPEQALAVIPPTALAITLSADNGRRVAQIKAPPSWRERLQKIAGRFKNQSKDAS